MKGNRVSRVTKNWGVVLVLSISFAGLLSCDCGTEPGPPENGRDTTSHGPDTTSHHFIWTTDTIGDFGSVLYDVAILNDTLAYAVGEIYLKDSTGQIDPQAYGLAICNGSTLQPKRLFYGGNNLIEPIRGLVARSSNDIWLAAGSIFHWDGFSTQASLSFSRLTLPDPNATVEKLWAGSTSSVYGVGNAGTIVRFDGTSWTRIESGTSLDMRDVWGDGTEIIGVASNPFQGPDRHVVRISTTAAVEISDSGITEPLDGVWFSTGRSYYLVGSGIYWKDSLSQSQWSGSPLEITPFYSNAVRGTGPNDVFVVGAFGDVWHFNGSTWSNYPELRSSNSSFYAVAVTRTLVMAVGFVGERALVAIGRYNTH